MAIKSLVQPARWEEEALDALEFVSNSEFYPVGFVVRGLHVLRLISEALPGPTKNRRLRNVAKRLPKLIEKLVRKETVLKRKGPYLVNEPSLLRLCAAVVKRVSTPSISVGEYIWLCFRLHNWVFFQAKLFGKGRFERTLCELAELSPPPVPMDQRTGDLLDPDSLGVDGIELRTAAIMQALIQSDLIAHQVIGSEDARLYPKELLTAGTKKALLTLIQGEPTDHERKCGLAEWPSALPWSGPTSVPELAFNVLLRFDGDAFLELSEEQQLRWIEGLPRSPRDKARVADWSISTLLFAMATRASKLSRVARTLLTRRLGTLSKQHRDLACTAVLLQLWAAGDSELGDKVYSSLKRNMKGTAAPSIAALYLGTLAENSPEEFRRSFTERFRELLKSSDNRGAVWVALAGIEMDQPAAIRRLLGGLRQLKKEKKLSDKVAQAVHDIEARHALLLNPKKSPRQRPT